MAPWCKSDDDDDGDDDADDETELIFMSFVAKTEWFKDFLSSASRSYQLVSDYIGVWSSVTLGARHFRPKIMYEKSKCPNLRDICPKK